jgi:hypothetical protein
MLADEFADTGILVTHLLNQRAGASCTKSPVWRTNGGTTSARNAPNTSRTIPIDRPVANPTVAAALAGQSARPALAQAR